QNRRLPCLTYGTRPKTDPKLHFDILVAEDAFRIQETVSSEVVRKRFLSGCADLVVGNPPWGAPQTNVPEELKSDGGIGWGDGEDREGGSIAPFAAVMFSKQTPSKDNRFAYWSAKETAFVKRVQAVVLNSADLRAANQTEYLRDETLWKIYWWGGHGDEALIQ